MINQFSYVPNQPLVDTYVEMPFQEILGAGVQKQKQFDVAKGTLGDIEDAFLKTQALNQDVQTRNKVIGEYKDALNKKYDEVKGDYSKLIPYADELARKAKYELSYGQLGAIQKSYDAYQQALKDYYSMKKEGKFQGMDDIAQYNWLQKAYNDYKGIGAGDQGVYNTFTPGNVGQYYDISKDASDFAQQWASSSGYGQLQSTGDGRYYSRTKNTYVSADKVKQGVLDYIKTNPKYSSQLQDYASYYEQFEPGLGNKMLNKYVGDLTNAIGAREGFVKSDITDNVDWKAQEDYKDALDKQKDIVSLTIPGFAGNYGAQETKDTKSLNTVLQGSISSSITELNKLFISAGYSQGLSTYKTMLGNPNMPDEEALNKWKTDTNNKNLLKTKLGTDAINTMNNIVNQYDNIKQRDDEATQFANKQMGGSLEEKQDKFRNMVKSQGLDLITFGNLISDYNSMDPTVSKIAQDKLGGKDKAKQLYDAYVAYNSYSNEHSAIKDKYLTDTGASMTQTMWQSTVMPGYTGSLNPDGTPEVDPKLSAKRTAELQGLFKNPANLSTFTLYKLDGTEVQGKDLVSSLYNKDGKLIAQASQPFMTNTSGMGGQREIRWQVNGETYIIPSNQIKEVADWVNTPQEQVNTFLFDAAHNGLQSKQIGDYKVSVPIVPSDPQQQGTYQFYNNSNFMIEDKSGKKVSGAEAYQVLLGMKLAGMF